jgi:hypothetical protein
MFMFSAFNAYIYVLPHALPLLHAFLWRILSNIGSMNFAMAIEVLPKFKHLEGMNSIYYRSKIERVYVSFRSIAMTKLYNNSHKGLSYTALSEKWDRHDFTIVAALENQKVISVRNLVIADKITTLYLDIKTLDYMNL